MISLYSLAKKIPEQFPIKASAPCRIDTGGTWDIKAMALPLEQAEPTTVNIALTLRTRVILSPYRDGWVKITSEGFPQGEEYPVEKLPFTPPFGLFFAAIQYFGFHGLDVEIRADSPVKSALGGSSSALVALIKALSKISIIVEDKVISDHDILHLGYHLEDGISGGNCGIQDQAAAVHGGVNKWTWSYGKRGSLFNRDPLLDRQGEEDLSDRVLVAYSGTSHISADTNRLWIQNFLSGRTRSGWIKANTIVKKLADAIKAGDWTQAAGFLKDEMAIRREITPDALIPITENLIDQAEKTDCGARFAGAGAGGSVWALGEPDKINSLKEIWSKTLSPHKGAGILDCGVDPVGAR
jgi:D-glycero-alpha-D-manno-heptose-7-phosphate kinase